MRKIRKGSIVWDTMLKHRTKVLTSPSKGELNDKLMLLSGHRYHKDKRQDFAFCKVMEEDSIYPHANTVNNVPAYLVMISRLMPYDEYLKSIKT
jgi:hypothetical protein